MDEHPILGNIAAMLWIAAGIFLILEALEIIIGS